MNGLPNGIDDEEGASLGMYSVKRPYAIPADIKLPNSMYRMGPINGQSVPPSISNSTSNVVAGCVSRGTLTQTSSNSSSTTSTSTGMGKSSTVTNGIVDSLELRQVQIIDKLTALRDMITSIHEKCIVTGSIETSSLSTSSTQKANNQMDEHIDIVIHANPESPPYSLIMFARLLENSYSNAVVNISSHIHSSFRGTVKRDQLAAFEKEESNANVRFTIVWKNVQACNMIVTPVQSTTINYEANIARFLSRLLPVVESNLNYDSLTWETLVKVDNLLDQAHKTEVVSVIETALKKSKQGFLAGELTVADLVLYSSVASKVLNKGQKDLSVSVRKWVKRIETGFGVWILGLSE